MGNGSKISLELIISQVALVVKNPPAMRETRVQLFGLEDPLDEGMVPHFSILA